MQRYKHLVLLYDACFSAESLALLISKLLGRGPSTRLRGMQEENIELDLEEVGYEEASLTQVVQYLANGLRLLNLNVVISKILSGYLLVS
jgi:hypothetical protein